METHSPVPPGSGLNLQDAQVVVDLFERAAEATLNLPGRSGSVVDLPDQGRLLMTGDLHDNGLNFQRLLKLAKLDKGTDRYLILHEIVHGPGRVNGRDLSIRTLARVAALVLDHPGQVLVMLANHELSQYWGENILKDGTSVVEAFDGGIDFLYHEDAEQVREAMKKFIASQLLAVRCANGVFCSHSLPAPRKIEVFDKQVINRVPEAADLAVGGSAYMMVWGRHHNQKVADELAEAWGAKVFVMGHQPAEMGYETEADNMLILASDHDHGMALPIRLDRAYTRDDLVGELVPLASVVL